MKPFPMSPDISTIVSDEDGHVSHQLYSALMSVAAQQCPLMKELILTELMNGHLAAQPGAPVIQRSRLSTGQFRCPLGPECASVVLLEGYK